MYDYNLDIYQNSLTLVILSFGYLLIIILGVKTREDILKITLLYLWHTIFSIIYFLYSLSNTADAKQYFRVSKLGSDFRFYPGSNFIYSVSSPFSKGFDANYLNTTLIFSLIGSFGLVFLYLAIKPYLRNLQVLWSTILFIPTMSFWSSGLGKDAISFFSVCLLIYTVTTNRKKILLIPLSFFSMFMVRPHVASMIAVSYLIYFIIQSRVHIVLKLIILPILATAILMSIGFVQQYVGLEDASLDSLNEYVDGRQSVNRTGGSSLDITSMGYPMQMFTYIFRPLPFDAHSSVALITSFENTALLLVVLYILLKSKASLKNFFKNENLWLFIYAFLTCTMLAITTANLGIATRQKWMFMPVVLYLLIYAYHDYTVKKNKGYV